MQTSEMKNSLSVNKNLAHASVSTNHSIDVYHNILWPRYKGSVFTELFSLSSDANININFFQIATTENVRKSLGDVDLSYHRYPYTIMFNGEYELIPRRKLCLLLFKQSLLSKSKVLVIPGYHLPEYWCMLLACLLTGKKRAVFCDSTRLDRPASTIKDLMKRIFFRSCHAILCYGERSKEYVEEFGVSKEKIVVGCQAAALPHDYTAQHILEERILRLSHSQSPIFLFVGVLDHRKGCDLLIRAFSQLQKRFPEASLVFVGDGPMRKELITLAKSLEISDSVSFAGARNIEELSEYYLSAHCLVLPSRSEPWGLVVNEALSYGCPAIVSDKCGCGPDLIIENKTGYVFESENITDLLNKMTLSYLAADGAKKRASDCIERMKLFTPQKAASRILNGLQNIFTRQDS
jgi:glycosyltransferase involved in cell wall biosynthesis